MSSQRKRDLKVLFVTPVLEHPAAGGPQLRIENSIKALNNICELHLGYRIDHENLVPEGMKIFYEKHCVKFSLFTWVFDQHRSNPLIRKLLRLLCKVFPLQNHHEVKLILDYVDKEKIDVLWFGYGNISYPLMKAIKSKRPELKTVCDTDSVWSRFVLRELPYASGLRKVSIWLKGKLKETEEKRWTEFNDVTTAVSVIDADYYQSLTSNSSKVKVFSNVIDLDTYKVKPASVVKINNPAIYLAGSFTSSNSPMDVAARWVINEILPKLKVKIPNIHLYLVGRNSDANFSQYASDSITVTGKVESVLPYLMNIDVALVPLKFESGTRFKILEAAACRIPIVSTTLGAEGIPVSHNKDILLADDTDGFVESIVQIIKDQELAKSLTNNCFNLIEESYSLKTLEREGLEIFDFLKATKSLNS